MKKLIILLLLFTSCFQLYAGNRTEQEMKEAAAKALNSIQMNQRRAGNANELKEFMTLSCLKIYGYENGGFVVVTVDDRFESVIGSSTSQFSQNLPCGFKWWLEKVNENMQKSTSSNITTQRRKALGTAVDPLITTMWGQGRPFNDNCIYTYNNNVYQCVTGCVATGLAQIMNYYQHPTNGIGSCTYDVNYNNEYTITFSEDFSQSTYDWDNMLNDYSAYYRTTTIDSHTQAVAKLMRDCGIASHMIYGMIESSANFVDAEYALKNYFSYGNSTKLYNRSEYGKDAWLELIYSEIDNGRPILYGATQDNKGNGGHAFIINGYDSSGNVYINWGWNGDCDGYFDIDMLNPSQYSLNYNQSMLIIVPDFPMHTLSLSVSGFGQVNYNGINGVTVRDNTKEFKVKNGSNPALYFSPDTKRKLKSITINGTEVTSDVSDNKYIVSNVTSDVSVIVSFESFEDEKYTLNGHEYVNLGLTSGKYWSTMNYGAEKPEDAGSYLTANESAIVATSWSISWKIPEKEDIQELLNECEWTWMELNGMAGYNITGPNGNSMFLPAVGTKNGDVLTGLGSLAYYQTASKDAQQTWVFQGSTSDKKLIATLLSSEAYPIRPISTNNVEVNEANFPDENFRNWILSDIKAANDGVLTANELKYIYTIKCSKNQIRDLKGIEFFTNIFLLECEMNSLTSLDLSKNVNLLYLKCYYNDLYSIDLSKNTSLISLGCGDNRLTGLDLSNNTALQSVECSGNQLTSLDLSKNTALQSVECVGNQLTSLDVSMLQSLNSLNCDGNPLKNIDISKNSALKTLNCAGNQLTSLDISNNSALERLECHSNQLTSLDISDKTKLTYLVCENNQLTNLDVSNNTELSLLDCGGNPLTSIDLSKNTKLKTLYCPGDSLKNLDLSNNTSLEFLCCVDNQLTSLDVSNNTALTYLECRINQLTNIDVSMLKNLERLAVSENQLTSLDVSNNPSLQLLFCHNNHLRLLNVSKNTELTNLACMFNLLTSLDVSKNTNIECLYIDGNLLTSLDLSQNTKLKELRCEINQLYNLDLSNNNLLNLALVSNQCPSMINYTVDELRVSLNQARVKVLNLSEELAIPVPSSFEFSKVSNLQLDNVGITGSVTTINGLKFLVLATSATPKSSIDGKRLSYSYDTNNNVAGLITVEVPLIYTGESHIWTDPETDLTWNYTISGDNVIIDPNAWATGDIAIPSVINGYTVSEIDFNAFSSSELTCLTIPSTVTSMSDYVIRGCINLEKLIIMAETPPTISDYTFVDYDVPLYVPDVAVSTYQNTNIWKNFTSIRPLSTVNQHSLIYMIDGEVYKIYTLNKGDIITPEPTPTKETYIFSGWSEIPEIMPDYDVIVTGAFERHFDVGHVVNVVNFIMNANATPEDIALYDMNNDIELNIGDIILIVKNILNQSGSASLAMRRTPAMLDFAQYTAAQFELKIDKNTSIKDIHLVSSMAQSHQLMCQQKDDNTYAIVVYSLSNQLMKPENGCIIEVEADGGNVMIQNVTVATQTGGTHYYQDSGTSTGVHQLENDGNSAVIYDLKGNRLNGKALEKGIYIINGKKAVVK